MSGKQTEDKKTVHIEKDNLSRTILLKCHFFFQNNSFLDITPFYRSKVLLRRRLPYIIGTLYFSFILTFSFSFHFSLYKNKVEK